jgi:hypothetical protein
MEDSRGRANRQSDGGDFALISGMSGGQGIAFVIGAASMAEFVAKACSSPQTVEINAQKRAPTLMKWVNVGIAEGALIIGATVFFDKKYAKPMIAGAVVEGLITYAEYAYGKNSGLANPGPPTEEYAADKEQGGFVYG